MHSDARALPTGPPRGHLMRLALRMVRPHAQTVGMFQPHKFRLPIWEHMRGKGNDLVRDEDLDLSQYWEVQRCRNTTSAPGAFRSCRHQWVKDGMPSESSRLA